MAKAKKVRISNNKIDEVVKVANTETTVSWNGIEFQVKKTVPLLDVIEIAHNASENVFSVSGVFAPEGAHILTSCGILEHYTNIELPASLEYRYDLIMRTDIMDVVLPYIDKDQLDQLMEDIASRVEHKRDMEVKGIERRIEGLTAALEQSVTNAAEAFSAFSREDMEKLIKAVGDLGALDEEKLMRAYMATSKE